MDRLDYREIIEKIIQQHAREQSEKDLDKVQVVFDKEQYCMWDGGIKG